MESNEILNEGISYLEKLDKMDPYTSKLGTEVIYNFVSLGIEAVLTAVLMENNRMVDHSGISRLLRELAKVEEVDQTWVDTARFMNRFQTYCSLEPIPVKIPNKDELVRIIAFGKSVETYANKKLKS